MKRATAPASAAVARLDARRPTIILCYHAIAERAVPEAVSAGEFGRQMALLAERCQVVALDELVSEIERGSAGPPLAAITFDDGYTGVLEHGLPILRSFGFVATAFVLPGLWGQTASWDSPAPASVRTLWDLDDARAWTEAGMRLGSHGLTHTELPSAGGGQIEHEIRRSRELLEDQFGPVAGFCYPWGRHTPELEAQVEAAGYRFAVAGGYRRKHAADAMFRLGRLTVDHDDDVKDFGWKLKGGYDWIDVVHRVRR